MINIISDYISYFFYQIVYMSLLATVIGLVILIIKKFTSKKLSPKANYLIWLLFIVILVLPIAIPSKFSIYNFVNIDSVKYYMQEQNQERHTDYHNYKFLNEFSEYISKSNNNNSFRKENTVKNLVAYIWFAIFIYKLIKSMILYFKNCKFIGNEKVQDKRSNLILEECKKKLKIKRKINLVKQNAIKTPAIMGIFKIKIIVNDEILGLDDMSLKNAFMHELSHFKRKDNLINFIMIILKSIYYFNPFIMYLFTEIKKNMEFATDEMAINKMNREEKINYCKLMLKIAYNNNLEKSEILGLSSSAKYLEERISLIGNKTYFEEKSKRIFIITFAIILLIMLVLYPTSYGIFYEPNIYLNVENTTIKLDEQMQEITINKNSKMTIDAKNIKSKDQIYYNILDLSTNELDLNALDMHTYELENIKPGNYIYTFILYYGNNEKQEYHIKINVE